VRTEFRNLFIGRESVTFRDFGNQATLAVFDARFHEFFARNRNVEAGPCGIKNSLQPDDIFAAVAGLPGNLKLTSDFFMPSTRCFVCLTMSPDVSLPT
jgi:hypothetical protein